MLVAARVLLAYYDQSIRQIARFNMLALNALSLLSKLAKLVISRRLADLGYFYRYHKNKQTS